MEFIKVRGVILKTIDYRERDRLIYTATGDMGKVTSIAKGVRGKKMKNSSLTQPLMLCDFTLYPGKNIHTVSEIFPVHSFGKLKEDYDTITYASYFLELMDLAMDDGEKNPRLFLDFIKTLYIMETGAFPLKLLARMFEIKVLLRTGNQPSPYIDGKPMAAGPRALIRFMLNKEVDNLSELIYSDEDLEFVGNLTEGLLKESFNRKPKSLDILNTEY